tara:strand:+ start:159 stop:767 length:609 start_codon:yes stop_codon:yes gene_type:complete
LLTYDINIILETTYTGKLRHNCEKNLIIILLKHMAKNLVLLGMMGVGKSTIGRKLAKKLNLKFFDTDQIIEKKVQMKIIDIFNLKGEKYFRKQEEIVVLDCLKNNNSLIALGGGGFINIKIRTEVLNKAISIWLDVDLETLSKRLNNNLKRPLLQRGNNKKMLLNIYKKRKSTYKLADFKVYCEKLNINQIQKKIINFYEKK